MGPSKTLIMGTTACGKGRTALQLARRLGAEIVSVDSMKVYRRMDIGTAKPPPEALKLVRHHLIDILEPSESFSAGLFVELAGRAIEGAQARGIPVIAVGGTALYIKALLYGLFEGPAADEPIRRRLRSEAMEAGLEVLHKRLRRVDPAAAERIDPNDERRIVRALEVYEITGSPISALQKQFEAEGKPAGWKIIGLRRQKEDNNRRINRRVGRMIEEGLVEEVEALLWSGQPLSKQAASAIGYAEIIDHLGGKIALEDAIEKIKINTRRLAKGQRTWFKRFKGIVWIDLEADTSERHVLEKVLEAAGK
jgi:tRNA dimethylallyltransferase